MADPFLYTARKLVVSSYVLKKTFAFILQLLFLALSRLTSGAFGLSPPYCQQRFGFHLGYT